MAIEQEPDVNLVLAMENKESNSLPLFLIWSHLPSLPVTPITVLPNDLQSNALGIVSLTHSCNSRRAIGVPPSPSLAELDNSLLEVGIRLSSFLTDY